MVANITIGDDRQAKLLDVGSPGDRNTTRVPQNAAAALDILEAGRPEPTLAN